jgi:hypothetical protein
MEMEQLAADLLCYSMELSKRKTSEQLSTNKSFAR